MFVLWLALAAVRTAAGAVSVATYAELAAAVADAGVAEIVLAADIVVAAVLVLAAPRALAVRGGGHTLDGAGASALFRVGAGAALTLDGITLARGSSATSGGCVQNYGALNATDVRFERCVAVVYGGGLYNYGGTVVLRDVGVSGCKADKFGGGVHTSGAGARVDGTRVAITDCYVLNGDGAGLHNNGGAVSLSDSVIARNRVTKRWAGGVWNQNGAFFAVNTSIVDNYSFRYGGGAHNHGGGTFRCVACVISRNVAAEGGGLTSQGTALELFDTVLEGNVAKFDGGGVTVLDGATVQLSNVVARGNVAGRGGFAFVYGTLVCDGVEATANTATDGAAVYLADRTAGASVLAVAGGFGLRVRGSTGHDRGTISVGAAATGVVVQGVAVSGSRAAEGAFLYVHPSASVRVERCTSDDDVAEFDGVVYLGVNAHLTLAGVRVKRGVSKYGSGLIYAVGALSLELVDSQILDCAVEGAGSGIYAKFVREAVTAHNCVFRNNTARSGAVIDALSTPVLNVSNSTFEGNAGARGSAIYSYAAGGAVVDLADCAFVANVAHGPAVAVRGGAAVTIARTTFSRNVAAAPCVENSGGAALRVDNGAALNLSASFFSANDERCGGGGGAVAVLSGAHAAVRECTFDGNTADAGGGALLARDASGLALAGVDLRGNTAGTDGGALFATSDCAIDVDAATVVFTSNSAAGGGGAAYVELVEVAAAGAAAWYAVASVAALRDSACDGGGNAAPFGPLVATSAAALAVDPMKRRMLATTAERAPSFVVRVLDAYGQLAVLDSSTTLRAEVTDAARAAAGGLDFSGGTQIVSGGIATFDALVFYTPLANVNIDVAFVATPAVAYAGGATAALAMAVERPHRPPHNRNELSVSARGFIIALALLNLGCVLCCAAFTWRFRARNIVVLSQPGYLYGLCAGCVVSTLSSVMPLLGRTDAACQLQLWLYGGGFIITTAMLYTKMDQMEVGIAAALALSSRPMAQRARANRHRALAPVLAMAAGEALLLAAWAGISPLGYWRYCVERHIGGFWAGACVRSVGTCRSHDAQGFVAALAMFHCLCLLAGMRMCYRVRNLPSIMAEGKWVFTGFYSQLQVFVSALPVLVMVKDDFETFTLLKSLVICAGDLTTLAMIFLPKMHLVYRYHDFDRTAVAVFIASTLRSTTQNDTVYEQLRVKDRPSRAPRTESAPKKATKAERRGPWRPASVPEELEVSSVGSSAESTDRCGASSWFFSSRPHGRVSPLEVGVDGVATEAAPFSNMKSMPSIALFSSAVVATADTSRRVSDRTERYMAHEVKNRLVVLADLCTDPPQRALVDELLAMLKRKHVPGALAEAKYVPVLAPTDVEELIALRLARYKSSQRAVVLEPTAGTAAGGKRALQLDATLVNMVLDNLLSNAFKYGDEASPPVLWLIVDDVAGDCVSLRLEVRSAAGVGHARLVALGEREFNRIAKAEGERAHTDLGASTSAGDGFPMACTCARALGGTLDLILDNKGVTAALHLPRVPRAAAARADARMFAAAPLRCAMVDDSPAQRKMMQHKCEVAFPQATFAVVAGENAASIRGFAQRVVDEDCDVVFVDQDFGDVLETMFGIDVVAAIRQLDQHNAAPRGPARQRLVFVVSCSDAPSDIELYANVGADGHIGKDATAPQLQQALFAANPELRAPAHPGEEPDV
ncbi:hypothetical protein M885DRAFT_547782 [Pelagophyceae sp. CCMP2097]|nr:hypothetical protein M885DRAFT_547782 [Pelagophyceae sp. CCMP2097]